MTLPEKMMVVGAVLMAIGGLLSLAASLLKLYGV